MDDLVKRLRDYADNPTEKGFVPISPKTLGEAAAALEVLHDPQKWMKWCDIRVLERAERAEAALESVVKERDHLRHQQVIHGWHPDVTYVDERVYEVMTEFNDDIGDIAAEVLALREQAEQLAKQRAEFEAELGRLTGKLCLICGAKEPCELDKSEMSPCTFDPHPIAAAQSLLRRAEQAESALARCKEDLEELRADNVEISRVALADKSAREAVVAELRIIVDAKRFDRKHFDDDTAFADWVQSRARHAIASPDVGGACPTCKLAGPYRWRSAIIKDGKSELCSDPWHDKPDVGGMVLVPREPTVEMVDAGLYAKRGADYTDHICHVWHDMLAAAGAVESGKGS